MDYLDEGINQGSTMKRNKAIEDYNDDKEYRGQIK